MTIFGKLLDNNQPSGRTSPTPSLTSIDKKNKKDKNKKNKGKSKKLTKGDIGAPSNFQ
jgi:hypothetical protein